MTVGLGVPKLGGKARWSVGIGGLVKAGRIVVVGALGALALAWVSRGAADGIPEDPTLFYAGVLEEAGAPVDGVRNVRVRLFDDPMTGTELCVTSASGVAFDEGRFRVPLVEACADAVRDEPDLWVELEVGTDAPFPRTKLGAVPYALEAESADVARGAEVALAARLSGVEGRVTVNEGAIDEVDGRVAALESRVVVRGFCFDGGGGLSSSPGFASLSVDRTGTGTYAISSSPSVSTGDSCTCSVQTSGRLARVVLVELDSGGFFVRVGDSNGAAHDEAVCCTCVSE